MARIRSARKQEVPLSTPRRRTPSSPASSRMRAPRAATRLAISLALNARLIFVARTFQPYLVQIARAGDAEPLGDLDARHPGDRAVPEKEWNPIPEIGSDFTINQKVFQLFVRGEAEGVKAVAVAAVADEEAGGGAFGQFDQLRTLRPQRPPSRRHSNRGRNLRDECLAGELDFELGHRLRVLAQDDVVAAPDQLELLRDADALDVVDLVAEPLEIGGTDIARVRIEAADVLVQDGLAKPGLARQCLPDRLLRRRNRFLRVVDRTLQHAPLRARLIRDRGEVLDRALRQHRAHAFAQESRIGVRLVDARGDAALA